MKTLAAFLICSGFAFAHDLEGTYRRWASAEIYTIASDGQMSGMNPTNETQWSNDYTGPVKGGGYGYRVGGGKWTWVVRRLDEDTLVIAERENGRPKQAIIFLRVGTEE
jgi:hypothetical protein